MKRIAFGLLTALALAPTTARAVVYDAVSDFAALPASSSPFTDGYRIGAGSFTAYNVSATNCAGISGLTCNYASGYNNNDLPGVGKNTTGSLIAVGTVRVPTDVLFMHPTGLNSGLAGGDTIVRFTAPTTDFYTVTGFYQLLDTNPSGVNVSIEGGSSTFAQLLTGGLNTTAGFSFGTLLNAGDTLDFVVNSAGSYYNDSTGLSAAISVPEPASLALLGLGAGLAGLRRRRAA